LRDPRLEIAARRLVNQRLAGEPVATAAEVVRRLGAVQAQEYPLARWSLGQRARDLDESAIDGALADGDILRTHVLRDTWHFVAAEDLRWIVELTRPRIRMRNEGMHRRLGLDARLLERTDALIVEALTERGRLTRAQLAALLVEHGIEAAGPRLAYVLMHAELNLLICSGGLEGKQHTYALVDVRAPRARSLSRDGGLVELARRFFTSHGPATVKDLAWWATLRVADVRRAIELLADELEVLDVDGRTFWSPRAATAAAGGPRAHLLQTYDEYVVAYAESRDVLDVKGLAGRERFSPMFILDGQFAGSWRRTAASRVLAVEVRLARPLKKAEHAALEEAVAGYARFVGMPVNLSTVE
jgi:hypothetical protein